MWRPRRCRHCGFITRWPHLFAWQCGDLLREAIKLQAQCARIVEHQIGWLLQGLEPDTVLDRTQVVDLIFDLTKAQVMAQHIIALHSGEAPRVVVPPSLQPTHHAHEGEH